MKKIHYIIPFVVIFCLSLLLYRELFFAKPNELPSALIGTSVPPFHLQTLDKHPLFFSQHHLKGRVSLLNFWATWCAACYSEHQMLMKISRTSGIPIYGIVYKDTPEEALRWLSKHGNPYVTIGNDYNGDAAIDFGVYGTPETYVINSQGKIVYRQIGAIDETTWNTILLPLIKKL